MLCAALFLFLVTSVATSWADLSMRCGRYLVDKGTLIDEVIAKCGDPYSTYGDYWLYRQGKVVYRLHFNWQGEVRRIQSEIRF